MNLQGQRAEDLCADLLRRAGLRILARRAAAPCRFDVLLLDALEPSRVQWIRNAFGE